MSQKTGQELKKNSVNRRLLSHTKLVFNILRYALDYFLVNRVRTDSISNDLGASFTKLTRERDRIRKVALPQGEEKLRDEIEWIMRFRDTPFARYLPKIYDSSVEKGRVFYEMKYYNYPNLRKIILDESNASYFVRYRLLALLELLRRELWVEANSVPCPPSFAETEHFAKFERRRDQALSMAPFLSALFDTTLVKINGKEYLNAGTILEAIRGDPAVTRRLCPERLYFSHGDVHSNNILCGLRASKIILIDCRGRSSTGTMYYDPAYDVGKLFHDFNSYYSLIEKHYYSIFALGEGEQTSVEYSFLDQRGMEVFSSYNAFIRSVLEENFTEYGNLLERADFNEAMHFLTMIPMHLKLRDEGMMCYVTGVMRLNEWMQSYHPVKYAKLASRVEKVSEYFIQEAVPSRN
jgi:hypothetical protein